MKLSIWQTEVSQSYTFASSTRQGGNDGIYKRRPASASAVGPPSVRFRVSSLGENVEPRGREIRGYVLARCEILSSRARLPVSMSTAVSLSEGIAEPDLNGGHMRFVLFSLPSPKNACGGGSNVCSRSLLVESAEVHVWEPWHEVSVNSRRQDSDNAALALQRVMLCTRFIVI